MIKGIHHDIRGVYFIIAMPGIHIAKDQISQRTDNGSLSKHSMNNKTMGIISWGHITDISGKDLLKYLVILKS